jgi:hypothetical protein
MRTVKPEKHQLFPVQRSAGGLELTEMISLGP